MHKMMLLIFMSFQIVNVFGQKLQLSMPKPNVYMAMVSKEQPFNLDFDFRMEGAQIRYTSNGTNPEKKNKIFVKPIKINKPCLIRAKAFHKDFDPSEIVSVQFLSLGMPILSYDGFLPNPKYSGSGLSTLFDRKFGHRDFNQAYLGYDKGPIEIQLIPDKSQPISKINIAYIIQQSSWIFGPVHIKVYDNNNLMIGQQTFENASKKSDSGHLISSIDLPKSTYNLLKLIIEPVQSIPEWHDGRGQTAWFFTDEIWVE